MGRTPSVRWLYGPGRTVVRAVFDGCSWRYGDGPVVDELVDQAAVLEKLGQRALDAEAPPHRADELRLFDGALREIADLQAGLFGELFERMRDVAAADVEVVLAREGRAQRGEGDEAREEGEEEFVHGRTACGCVMMVI